MKNFFLSALTLLIGMPTMAQKIESIKVGGRIYFDGGIYNRAPDGFVSSVKLPDTRLGTKIYFENDWLAFVSLGFVDNKVNIKHVYLQKRYEKKHVFRLGHQFGYTGIDQTSGTVASFFSTDAPIANSFYSGRRLGLVYTYDSFPLYMCLGGFVGDKLQQDEGYEPGYSLTGRFIYRQMEDKNHLFQIGFGGMYKVPDINKETDQRYFSLVGKAGTMLASKNIMKAEFENVKSIEQLNAEILTYSGKFYLQGEYEICKVNGNELTPSFRADGGYVMVGYLLRGENWGYNQTNAISSMPTDKNSLVAACRFNLSNFNDGILKYGLQKDISVGLDYYSDSHISFKLNYSYYFLDKNTLIGNNNFSLLQCRMQVVF